LIWINVIVSELDSAIVTQTLAPIEADILGAQRKDKGEKREIAPEN